MSTRPEATAVDPRRVAVVGGGIAGLTCAHLLLKAGLVPVLIESTSQLGGLATFFEHDGFYLERFYHIVVDSDSHLIDLLVDLKLDTQVVWRESRLAFLADGKLYPFNTAADLLRFRPLPLQDRLGAGRGGLRVRMMKGDQTPLDAEPAGHWLRRIFGVRVTAAIWEPLLRAKFGEAWPEVPAYYVWSRVHREKGGKKEVKGYVQGGYRGIAEALRNRILEQGGEIRLNSPVDSIEQIGADMRIRVRGETESYRCVVSTLPLPLLSRAVSGTLTGSVPLPDLKYQGVVNVVVVSRRALQPFYWVASIEPSFPFQGLVETTNVIPNEWVGGRHLIYLLSYGRPGSEDYSRSDPTLRQQALAALARHFPGFSHDHIEAVYVFRAPFVEPVWTVGYLQRKPAVRIGGSGLFLCTTAQAYPSPTSWNTSVALARNTVQAVVEANRIRQAGKT
jgi:protoporphyrinogen oxidase